MTTTAAPPVTKHRVLVGRLTRETLKDLHDAYIMPSGRVYYRHNMGQFHNGEPPCKAGALLDLSRAVYGLKQSIVEYLATEPERRNLRLMRDLAEGYKCSFDTQFFVVDSTAF